MTRDDIIRMAREAGGGTTWWPLHSGTLERFAALVAAKEREACEELWEQLRIKDDQIRDVIEASVAVEREACAQIALQWDKEHPSTNFGGCIARSIRARGQA
jgi:hypothetical protein